MVNLGHPKKALWGLMESYPLSNDASFLNCRLNIIRIRNDKVVLYKAIKSFVLFGKFLK